MTTKPKSAAERIKALVNGAEPETEKLNPKPKSKNGGARPGAGRKANQDKLIAKGIHQWVEDHINEEVDVVIQLKNGKTVTLKKPRVVRVLQKLYEIGMTQGNVPALNSWLDRGLGKAMQPLEHRGDKNAPIFLSVDI